jgi:hypothetical protein
MLRTHWWREVFVSSMGICIALAAYVAAGPGMAGVQTPSEIAGRWSVERTPESNDFRSPALGPDLTIEQAGQRVTVEYSLNRKRTWTLDGVLYKTVVRVADAGTYNEIGSARIDKGRFVLVTGRDRGGRVAREERILYLKDDKLVVEGTSWLDDKVVRTSILTYHRSAPSKKQSLH